MKQKGFTIIELLLSITVIAAAVTVLVSANYWNADLRKARTFAEQIDDTATRIRNAVLPLAGDYQHVSNNMAISMGLVADDWIKLPGPVLMSPWNGAITYNPANVVNPNDAFDMQIDGMRTRACLRLTEILIERATRVSIRGMWVKTPNIAPPTITLITNQCTSPLPVTVVYTLQ
ncbi:type II secretion system protein [Thiolapillus sp.]|uniref:type II secretion system protein n=1 Tax=Thiolapillus sp. TaxID=2017437 RepID=UPI003AF62323